VLPFDNLTSDPGQDWMNQALPLALAADLTASRDTSVSEVNSVERAYALQATQLVHGYFSIRNGVLELRADIEDAGSHKTIRALAEHGPLSAGAIPLVNHLAKEISPSSEPFSTANNSAFEALGKALIAREPAEQDRAFEAAVRADPSFSAAYVLWAEALLQRGDKPGVSRVVEAAASGHPRPLDQAKLAFLDASAKADAAAQLNALKKWSNAAPADASVARQLGELETARREFPQAVQDFERAGKLTSDDPALLNMLGYAQAYAGDLDAARRTLEQYQKLSPPQDSNPLDSLGEVSFYLGDFLSAEKFFETAHTRNPPEFGGIELLKAAQARLMTGDLPGADAIFHRFTDFRKQIPGSFLDLQLARWDFLAGRRKQAIQSLEAASSRLDANSAAIALSQLSVWKLETGDQKSAIEYARQAADRATSPAARTQSAICRYIAAGESENTGAPQVEALSLLFQKKFGEALPLLETAYRDTSPNSDGQIRTLLAWANIEAGRMEEARALLRLFPIPLASGDILFSTLVFPRILYLKSAVLENEGKHDDARKLAQLYLKFAGDLPSIFASPRLVSR
jgi:tetratricopeptide (TPR) repeat protein